MGFTVTVVIPTVGRTSLGKSIRSALDQTVSVERILIVDDSPTQDALVTADPRVQIVHTGGSKGPAYSRNVGIGMSKSQWVAFLDDDDFWLPTHIEKILNFCTAKNLDAAYSSAIVNGHIRPDELYDGKLNPLKQIYGSKKWRKTKLYFPTPGLIVSRNVVAHLSFNNNIFEREDLWFAHKLYEYQFKFAQSSDVTAVINQNSIRSITRTSIQSDFRWAERLELIDSSARDNFLKGVAFRNAFIRKDWRGMRKIARLYPNGNFIFRLLSMF
jgi:glycosyltransferase involved in cell wall biosynthesis